LSSTDNSTQQTTKPRLLKVIGPGILVAATGVGAGDLATGALTGSKLGIAVLWAVVVGAALKFVLNEGLARWQLATGDTLLEGCVTRFGRPLKYIFVAYLIFWSLFVGSALMSACGVAAHAILPVFDAKTDKILYGLIHSALAVWLVRRGGYRLFERVMSLCIAVMFVTVMTTAVYSNPSWAEVGRGLVTPIIPDFNGEGLSWTIALMGGVGGTVTVLCYGYWIREEGRTGIEDLKTCRIDLATGYTMTALFGIGMVILGSTIEIGAEGGGAQLIVLLADQLETAFGRFGGLARWMFLIGAWGAIASSLLGVWQSVPYLFADLYGQTPGTMANRESNRERQRKPIDTRSRAYRWYLYGLAVVPAAGLWWDFTRVQKLYAIVGPAFMPMLALVLLILNGSEQFVGRDQCNSKLTTAVLAAALLFFVIVGWYSM
jgi:Mn2+/Fe2+ NRAMP family transporter